MPFRIPTGVAPRSNPIPAQRPSLLSRLKLGPLGQGLFSRSSARRRLHSGRGEYYSAVGELCDEPQSGADRARLCVQSEVEGDAFAHGDAPIARIGRTCASCASRAGDDLEAVRVRWKGCGRVVNRKRCRVQSRPWSEVCRLWSGLIRVVRQRLWLAFVD